MSLRFATPLDVESDADNSSQPGSNSDDFPEEDNNFDDWVSDHLSRPCRSLFDDKNFPTAEGTIQYDESVHGFNLIGIFTQLNLDLHKRIRLINFIRRHKPSVTEVANLTGAESFFSSDEYLIPVIEDDPLLQLDLDGWSDDEEPSTLPDTMAARDPIDLPSALRRISVLEEKLSQVQKDFVDYRALVAQNVNVTNLKEILDEPCSGPSTRDAARDDDSHYFQSYNEVEIHAVMIQDRVRTSTYASFILKNPLLFKDAIVLDIGCGTGILSLFAAKSGAKHVYAVDASDIAEKAEKIVQENGLGNIITVIRGKVEEISLPDGITHVDIILSEWMGYALLYESMLDSVLHARDRFLSPSSGIIAPSQCRMMLALCEGNEIHKERARFWNDVYGFDLSEMSKDVYNHAIIDVVSPESIVSDPYIVKDLHLHTITPHQLDFKSTFSLTCKSPKRIKIHAFILYFDTFFATGAGPLDPSVEVTLIKEGDPLLAEVWPVGGKPPPKRRMSMGSSLKGKENKVTSFSTGPLSHPTHWKQTIFLLRDPIPAEEGTVVSGTFSCRKNNENSRELDIEIHYSIKNTGEASAGETVVQIYTVR
ncbi:hypothetical protein ID866_1706 [Astraeus odoratus]|nr:hypothetical protein ID866_1706 [Astraeus odoratus]